MCLGLFPPPLRDGYFHRLALQIYGYFGKVKQKGKKNAGLQPCNPAINGVFEEKNCDFWKFLQVFGKGINSPCPVNQ